MSVKEDIALKMESCLGMLDTKCVHEINNFCIVSVKTLPEQTTLILDHDVEHAIKSDLFIEQKQISDLLQIRAMPIINYD